MNKIIITPNRIKIICSFILLACLVLPFSSCTRHLDKDGKDAYSYSSRTSVRTITEYKYPANFFYPDVWYSYFFIYSFFWPIPILLHRYYGKSQRLKTVFWVSEPLFVLGSIYCAMAVAIFDVSYIGRLLVFTTNGCYGLTWFYESVRNVIFWVMRKKALKNENKN